MKNETRKLYYSIGEVSELVDVKPHVLRYWETQFPVLKPKRSRAGNRTYRIRDIKYLLTIKHLLYEKKFTIAGAKKQLKSHETNIIASQKTTLSSDHIDETITQKMIDLKKQLTQLKKLL